MKDKSKSLNNKDIVIYALYLLGGWKKRIHTEDIALECFKIAPRKFSWVKHSQYPDMLPSLFALEAAKKQQHGELVIGETERKKTVKIIGGWMLTVSGVKWIKENLSRIEQSLNKNKIGGTRLHTDRKLEQLYKSTAFNKFLIKSENTELSHAEFAESLICTINTRSEKLNDRLNQLSSIAEELNKEEVKSYIDFCRKKFSSILESKRGDSDAE